MAERKLSLIILGKATGALAAMKSVGDEAGGLGKKITNLLPSFKTVAIAGAAAFAAVGAAAFKAVQAAAEDQESQRKLAEQLRRTTGATDEQIASVEKLIAAQEIAVGVTDTELRGAMSNLVRSTGDAAFAQEQLTLALDISAATGKDLNSVSEALGKAFLGNVGALTRLGVPLDQNVIKSKNLTEVVKTLNQQFSGAAAASADTFSGRMRILQISFENVVEGIGYALLPMAERLVAFIQTQIVPVLSAFSTALQDGKGVRGALVEAGAAAGDFGLKAINMVETVTKAFVTFSNIMITLARPLVYVLGAIASGLVLIFTRSMSAYKETATTFKNVYDQMGTLQVSTDSVALSFQKFRNDVLGVAAASTVTQEQLRALEQQARQTAAGTANVVQPFIGPLLQGYGASATAAKSATDLNAEFAKTLSELQSKAGGAGGAVKKAADAVKTYRDAVIGARDATRSQADAAQSVTKAQADVAAKTKAAADAQARFDNVVRGFPSNAKESIEANRRLADAQRGVRDAAFGVTDAQNTLRSVEERLAKLRAVAPDPAKIAEAQKRLRDATLSQGDAVRSLTQAEARLAELRALTADPDDVAAAERDLQRAKFGVEEANFRIADAEQKLADLRLSGEASPTELRRAEIDLEEAKLAVFDAVRSVTESEQRLAKQRSVGATAEQLAAAERELERAKFGVSDANDAVKAAEKALNDERAVVPDAREIAEAERELERAKYAVADALDAQTVATTEQADAQKNLNEITFGAVIGSAIYDAALKDLEKAKEDQVAASENLTRALRDERDAMRELIAAQEELLRVQAATKANIQARVNAGLGVNVGAGGSVVEAIVGAGSTTTNGGLTLNVTAPAFTNPVEVGASVVDALEAYLRSNGSLPFAV